MYDDYTDSAVRSFRAIAQMQGRRAMIADVMRITQLSEGTVRYVVGRLVKAGVIHRTETARERFYSVVGGMTEADAGGMFTPRNVALGTRTDDTKVYGAGSENVLTIGDHGDAFVARLQLDAPGKYTDSLHTLGDRPASLGIVYPRISGYVAREASS